MTPSRLEVWPPLSPQVYLRRPSARLPFPLEEPGCRLFERARHGLWHGMRALGLEPDTEILVPAYHHGSEIEALVRAGLTCRFYNATETLEPDESELGALLNPRVRALYLIHYLGFPQDVWRWRAWCDARRLLLIEDAAQAWLASIDGCPVGTLGDLSIFCLYKTFGLPDGGALFSHAPPPEPESPRRSGVRRLGLHHVEWLKARSGWLAGFDTRRRPRAPVAPPVPGQDFMLGDPGSPPSSATRFLLPHVAHTQAAARRRANYQVLLDYLADHVPPPFAQLPRGASPFAFPIATERKAALRERLAADGITALNFWSTAHPLLPTESFPHIARLRARVLGLPVHQELLPQDLERVARAVQAFLAGH
jgi:perosamine synthetase